VFAVRRKVHGKVLFGAQLWLFVCARVRQQGAPGESTRPWPRA